MECKFHVGQKVVCINDDNTPEFWKGFQFARLGNTYTIRSIFCFGEQVVLRFEEIVNPVASYRCGIGDCEPGFKAENFRPLVTRKTDISQLKALLNTQRVRVDA